MLHAAFYNASYCIAILLLASQPNNDHLSTDLHLIALHLHHDSFSGNLFSRAGHPQYPRNPLKEEKAYLNRNSTGKKWPFQEKSRILETMNLLMCADIARMQQILFKKKGHVSHVACHLSPVECQKRQQPQPRTIPLLTPPVSTAGFWCWSWSRPINNESGRPENQFFLPFLMQYCKFLRPISFNFFFLRIKKKINLFDFQPLLIGKIRR